MKNLITRSFFGSIFTLSLLITTGCAALQPQPTVTPTATSTETPTLTATFTATVQPSETPAPTASQTPEPTATPGPDFSTVKVIGVTQNVNGVLLVIQFPNIQQAYALTLDNVDYVCSLAADVPDRLFCNGLKKPSADKEIPVKLTDPSTDTVVFESTWTIASAYIPTDVPIGDANTWCPDRGKDIKCEYECRLDDSGTACMIASCYDACGYYFSVDSCPAGLEAPFTPCDGETLERMKARYNIP